jgi:hypothetical protein
MMREITVRLSEPEAQALEEMASEAGISLEEAIVRSVRYVLKEAMPFHPNYLQFRSKLFWEHFHYLRRIFSGGGQ